MATTTKVSLDLPGSLLAALRRAPHEMGREVAIAAAIHWYQHGTLSMKRAAEAAGMGRRELLAERFRRRVDAFAVDFEDLEAELSDA